MKSHDVNNLTYLDFLVAHLGFKTVGMRFNK